MNRTSLIFSIPILYLIFACQNQIPKTVDTPANETKLTSDLAKNIFALPTHCLEIEYPNKLGQVLGNESDLKTPKALRPVFYGCFDWHSSVHGYWSIVKLMKKFPELDSNGVIRALLNKHITAENVRIEQDFFEDKNNLGFERTYGWAWLFKLQEELHTWDDPDAKRWETALQPLVDLLVNRYIKHLPDLLYPIRSGQHDNSAFGLSLSLDYARTVQNEAFIQSITTHAKRLFLQDQHCNLAYEPSGSDFLSPCFEEAFLMSKILHASQFDAWLKVFMPNLYQSDFTLEPGKVKDRTDGKLVHLDGLNYSRAACLFGIAKATPSLSHLKQVAEAHIAYSIDHISSKDDYMGSHWLGTFALYALSSK